MISMAWLVRFNKMTAKAVRKLPIGLQATIAALVAEIEVVGPALQGRGWRNFGKLKGRIDEYHCHLKNGRPTFVACWRIAERSQQIVEVYYVGTHEGAPY
jgi:hypothetical protein